MRSKRGFYERTYTAEQWDELEKRLLGVGDAVPKVPDVPVVPAIYLASMMIYLVDLE